MAKEQLIMNIGRIERALSRIERYDPGAAANISNSGLASRHEKLKTELRDAIVSIDTMLAGKKG